MLSTISASAQSPVDQALKKIDSQHGIVCVLGLDKKHDASFPLALAQASELQIYFQSADARQVRAVREKAEAAGLLGKRLFADQGPLDSIHLANNIADAILVSDGTSGITDDELLRALRPLASAFIADRTLTKPVPAGSEDWSHPYHSPDNNPNSNDQLAKGKLRTQFISAPKFSPMPQQTVIGGGRIYKAMGHIAHKKNQNVMLNTLLCMNAYNGTILWKRPLPKGFMIHRNTMIATPDALYLGDHESCKIIDGKTGEVRSQITIPKDLTDGQTWKWMGMKNNTLYALVGNPEVQVDTQKATRRGLGHWPWAMWKGHEYSDPRTSFGFGRTLVAIDTQSGKIKWNYRDQDFLDARAVCMNEKQIYIYSPEKFLMAIDLNTGKAVWKNSDKDLIEAIGPNAKAQHYITGYSTSNYIKCNKNYIFFAGPQREKMTVASTKDGKLAWTHPTGNLQLVLRKDAIYAAGSQKGPSGSKLDYSTGKILKALASRRACTRATGGVDSIFYRASGGTIRLFTDTDTPTHIDPMRPACQDGVLISNGHLYWGPWMCGCQLSLYGNITLGPDTLSTSSIPDPAIVYKNALTLHSDPAKIEPLNADAKDWPAYRGDNQRANTTQVKIANKMKLLWQSKISNGELPTAPVTAGGLIFTADRSGLVRATDNKGKPVWKNYTAGPVYYPPAISNDRLFVGSADGRVYAFEAKSGRLLWTFRVGQADQFIPVFGKLVSSWPVAGGVVIDEKSHTLYAAAGITHYDGTFVVALDTTSGKLKFSNTTSGQLSSHVDNGISLQGNLKIIDGELQFLGGGVYETARYDLKNLANLNPPKAYELKAGFRTAFYPYYPDYGKYVSLEHEYDNGTLLCHNAAYEGSAFADLALQAALPDGKKRATRDKAGEWLRRRGKAEKPKNLWQDQNQRRFTSFIVSGDQLLSTGHPDEKPEEAFMALTNVKDGKDVWLMKLPALPVKGGSAIDHLGNIYLTLENGELLCYSKE
ncbi:MAG: PQQ-binding-like beta-propeller repeat protein [Verrucomicrobiota bacterium]